MHRQVHRQGQGGVRVCIELGRERPLVVRGYRAVRGSEGVVGAQQAVLLAAGSHKDARCIRQGGT